MNIERSLNLVVGLTLSVLLGMVAVAGYSAWSVRTVGDGVLARDDLLRRLERLRADTATLQSVGRGYMITGETRYRTGFEDGRLTVERELGELARLRSEDLVGSERWRALRGRVEDFVRVVEEGVRLKAAGDDDAARLHVASGRGQQLLESVRLGSSEFSLELVQKRDSQIVAARETGMRTAWILAGGLTLDFILLGLVLVLGRRQLRARERAERAQEEARRYADDIIDSVRESLVILSADLRVWRANRSYYLAFGTTAEAVVGRGFAEVGVGEWNQPDLLGKLARVVSNQAELVDHETTIHRPGGGPRVMLLNARKLYRPGNHTDLIVLAIEDVTARRQAEEERERFFTLSLDLLCVAGADGRMKRVSPSVHQILGWTPEEFMARPFVEFVHPEDQAATLVEIDRMLKAGERVLNFENRYQHKEGGWRVLSWRATPHTDGLLYANARDVTERRRAEDEVRRLNEDLRLRAAQLEAANGELEAFSYSVSHDLRAPLRHIDGFAQLLRRKAGESLDATAARYVDTIAESARKLGVLIDELLQFSRLGRTELRRATTDMRAMVEEVRRELLPEVNGRRVDWRIGELPTVEGDATLLRQVWRNLLGNAVKYSRHREVAEIEVTHGRNEADGHVFAVRDNGAGFEMAYAGKLFGVFQRLHSEREFEGTGVGLANVRRIVQRHGGRAWAEGRPGEGATFYFSLPDTRHTNSNHPPP